MILYVLQFAYLALLREGEKQILEVRFLPITDITQHKSPRFSKLYRFQGVKRILLKNPIFMVGKHFIIFVSKLNIKHLI
jgi:hypothetical protein